VRFGERARQESLRRRRASLYSRYVRHAPSENRFAAAAARRATASGASCKRPSAMARVGLAT